MDVAALDGLSEKLLFFVFKEKKASVFFNECSLVHMITELSSGPRALDWWIRFSSSPVSADGRLCPRLISLWSLIISPSVVLRSGGSHRQHHVAFGCTHYNIHSITHSHYPSCKKINSKRSQRCHRGCLPCSWSPLMIFQGKGFKSNKSRITGDPKVDRMEDLNNATLDLYCVFTMMQPIGCNRWIFYPWETVDCRK